MSRGLPIACVALGLAAGARPAAAERAIAVDIQVDTDAAGAIGAPFSADELAAAVRVRVAPAGPPLRLRVTPIASGVHVDAPGGGRDVDTGGLVGADAARLVALAADDLIDDRTTGLDSALASPLAAARSAPVPPRASPDVPIELAALVNVGSWAAAFGAVAVDIALPLGAFSTAAFPHGTWLVAASAGAGTLLGGAVSLTGVALRVELGARTGPVELRAGAVAAPIWVSNGLGDSTALVGGGASVRVHFHHAVLAAGADVFATQTEYRIDGSAVWTTPRIAPWCALGVEVAL